MENIIRKIDKIPLTKWDLISIYDNHSFVEGELIDIDHVKKNRIDILKGIGCNNYLPLKFHDVNKEKKEQFGESIIKGRGIVLFNESHAIQIKDFVEKIQKIEEKIPLVIHCHAGISRSATLGLFLTDYFKLDVDKYLGRNENMMLNDLEMEILQKVFKHDCDETISKYQKIYERFETNNITTNIFRNDWE